MDRRGLRGPAPPGSCRRGARDPTRRREGAPVREVEQQRGEVTLRWPHSTPPPPRGGARRRVIGPTHSG